MTCAARSAGPAASHVLSVDYRLAPEHKAPAGSEDAYAAYLWAREHAAELAADPQRVAVGGDSAGGNLAALVSLRARDEDAPLPALQLLLYPVTDYRGKTRSRTLFARGFFLTGRDMDWFSERFLERCAGRRRPIRGCHRCWPTTCPGCRRRWCVTAGFDPLRDEGRHYADALREAGVAVDYREYGSLVHGVRQLLPAGRWQRRPRPRTSSRRCARI